MKLLLCYLAAASCLLADVTGTVLNSTIGKPQPAITVTLVQPGAGGMKTLGSTKSDSSGNFKIEQEIPPGPALLQAAYQGATYNLLLTPGAPTNGVQLSIYDSTAKAGTAAMTQRIIVIEPSATAMNIGETVVFENGSNLTFQDPAHGALEFYLPEAAGGKVQVTVSGTAGMPLPRPAEKTSQKNVFKVSYPLKPGETRFDISYVLPPSATFSGRILQKGVTRMVTPGTVTLTGDSVEALGQEPKTQARIYDLKSDRFNIHVEGTGSLHVADDSAQGGDSGADTGEPPVTEARARIYSQLYWILGLTLAMLAAGGAILFRKGKA